MYILRPPPLYTPHPTPRRVFSGAGGGVYKKFGPVVNSHDGYRRIASESHRWDSNHQRSLVVITPPPKKKKSVAFVVLRINRAFPSDGLRR